MVNCYICKDKGLFGYHKPMVGLDGKIHMIFVPQRCNCEAGVRLSDIGKEKVDNSKSNIGDNLNG